MTKVKRKNIREKGKADIDVNGSGSVCTPATLQCFVLLFNFKVPSLSGVLYFQIPVQALVQFVEALEIGYSKHKNPYHNLIHAADVTQTAHFLMLHTGLMVTLTRGCQYPHQAGTSYWHDVCLHLYTALAQRARDPCDGFCRSHSWLWTHGDHQQLSHPHQVLQMTGVKVSRCILATLRYRFRMNSLMILTINIMITETNLHRKSEVIYRY